MDDHEATTEAAPILDFNGQIEQAIAIEIANGVPWVELGRQHELLIEPGCAHRAVYPKRDASEAAAGKLSVERGSVKHQNCDEKGSGRHTGHTSTGRSSLSASRIRPKLNSPCEAGA
jgi:hypothetical protein